MINYFLRMALLSLGVFFVFLIGCRTAQTGASFDQRNGWRFADVNQVLLDQAIRTNRKVISEPIQGYTMRIVPGPMDEITHCRQVEKQIWHQGFNIDRSLETVCQ